MNKLTKTSEIKKGRRDPQKDKQQIIPKSEKPERHIGPSQRTTLTWEVFNKQVVYAPRYSDPEQLNEMRKLGIGPAAKSSIEKGCRPGVSMHYFEGSTSLYSMLPQKGGQVTFIGTDIYVPIMKELRDNNIECLENHILAGHERIYITGTNLYTAVPLIINPCRRELDGDASYVAQLNEWGHTALTISLQRFKHAVEVAKEYGIRSLITGHGAFFRMDGVNYVSDSDSEVAEAKLNMMEWILRMGKIGRFGIEDMPEANPLSDFITSHPNGLIWIWGAPNVYPVIDIAHTQLNQDFLDFKVLGYDFKEEVNDLWKFFQDNKEEIGSRINETNRRLKEIGLSEAVLSLDELSNYLEKLREFASASINYDGRTGIGAILACADELKRLQGLEESGDFVIHVALSEGNLHGKDAGQVKQVLRSDVPFRKGTNTGDSILGDVLEWGAQHLARDPDAIVLIVDESGKPPSKSISIETYFEYFSKLRKDIRSIYEQRLGE